MFIVVDIFVSRGVAMMNEKIELLLILSVLLTGVMLSLGHMPMLATLVFLGMLSFWRDVNQQTLKLKRVKINQ